MRPLESVERKTLKDLLQSLKDQRQAVTIDCGANVDLLVDIVEVFNDYVLCRADRFYAFPLNQIKRVYWPEM